MDGADRADERRAERVARARASGRCAFLGIDLELDPRVEVPTHEAEVLARAVAAWLAARHGPIAPWVVDARCGSGHLACSLALAVPRARIWACDPDADAARVAVRNVLRLGLDDRVDVRRGDLATALAGLHLEGRVHGVLCSAPPATLPDETWSAVHHRLLEDAAGLLRLGGRAYVEVDPAHPDRLRATARAHASYEWLDFARDEAGRPCAAILRRVAARQGPRIPRRDACAMRSESTFVTSRPRP